MDSDDILGLDEDSDQEQRGNEKRVDLLDPSQRGWMITGDQSTSIQVHGYCALGFHGAEPMAVRTLVLFIYGWIRQEQLCDSTVSMDITHTVVKYILLFRPWNSVDLMLLESGGQQPQFFLVPRHYLELSTLLCDFCDSGALSFKVIQVPGETLHHVVNYLAHHKGKQPDPLPCPVRSIHMAQIVSDKWDATWIDAMDKNTIFELILAANYMGIESLCFVYTY